MDLDTIYTQSAPEAIGPYSQAISTGSLLFTSGQIAIDPTTNELVEGGIEEQTRQVLTNIDAILDAAGTSRENIIMCNVYLKDLSDFTAFNSAYADFFGEHKPARVTVEVSALPKGALVEISVIAKL